MPNKPPKSKPTTRTKSTSVENDYLTQRRKWYAILEKEGFDEQEDINLDYLDDFPPLKKTSWNAGEKLKAAQQNGTEEYYRVAMEYTHQLPKNSTEWSIWVQHSNGATIPEIICYRHKNNLKTLSKDQIKRLLVRVRKRMLDHLEAEHKKTQEQNGTEETDQ